MANARYFPKADSVSQDFAAAFPGVPIKVLKFLLHTTEGHGWPSYDGGAKAPQLTIMIDSLRPRTSRIRQHFPVDMSSRALKNAEGGAETNKDDVLQIEIVCTSGWASPENPSAPWVVPLKAADLPDWFLRDIGEIWAWSHVEHGTPLTIAAEFRAWNGARPTLTAEEWDNAVGLLGHQHVPEGNTNTDPGAIDAERIQWHALDFIRIWARDGYPYGDGYVPPALPPEPTYPPTLRLGDKGEHVEFLQRRLFAKGHNIDIDSVFGNQTDNAVRIVQSDAKLTVDGVVGPKTWAVLIEVAEPTPTPVPEPTPKPPAPAPVPEPEPTPPPPAPTPAPTPVPEPINTVGSTIRRGDTGLAVVAAQKRLIAHGYTLDDGADGKFGPQTETRVREIQAASGLDVDGVVGPKTWDVLDNPTKAEGLAIARRVLPKLGWTWKDGQGMTSARLYRAIINYQRGCNLTGHAPLKADGVVGPKTAAAMEESERRRANGKPDASDHFSFREMDCKCEGIYSDCQRIMTPRIVVQGMEEYRKLSGPFTPISVYRCDKHNAKTPNAYEFSAHRRGLAFDVAPRFSWRTIQARGFAPAIGHWSNGLVCHLDWRHLDDFVNRPKISGSVTNPYRYNTYG